MLGENLPEPWGLGLLGHFGTWAVMLMNSSPPQPLRLHDFRHTVVALLLELGTPPPIVQAIARHADLGVMREALDKID